MENFKSSSTVQSKSEYLLNIIQECHSIHEVYKALFCLAQLSDSWHTVKHLYRRGIVDTLRKLCDRDEPQLVRVIAYLITHMIQMPEDLRVWFKFDSANPAVNSGGMTNTVRIFGKPGRMPPDRGIFRNWGSFFDFNDSLQISGGLDIMGADENETNLEFSITFWTILPAVYETKRDRVLVQNIYGTGAYFAFALNDKDKKNVVRIMGCRDE